MSKTFKFWPDAWMANRDLRACSAAARGFWVDLLVICHANGGYLHIKGQPIDDNQLARMVGEPVKSVRGWLKELGEAGIYSVDEHGLYSSRMRKTTTPAKKVSAVKSKPAARAAKTVESPLQFPPEDGAAPEQSQVKSVAKPVPVAKPVAKPKAIPWYKTNAGWARKAGEQGISLIPGEELDDFKARVAGRIPPGPHLDELSEHHKKAILAKVEQYAAKEDEQPKLR